MSDPAAVLDFWFRPAHEELWFKRSDDFDRALAAHCGAAHAEAASGAYDETWCDTAEGSLALVLLLDQASRNLYRDDGRAFAQDAKAREIARLALQRGFDVALPPIWRLFLYMPFEHSEDLADQYCSVALIGALQEGDYRPWAVKHLEVIERFGRFPTRNAALGRPSTEAELAYLAEGGSGF